MNFVWLALLAGGILVCAAKGEIQAVTVAATDAARSAVDLVLRVMGIITVWLGLVKVAERAGMVEKLARVMTAVASFLFPSVPRHHPALAAVAMNMSANLLGLGSAATPFGLKAMQELQTLNPVADTATDPMCTLLALNTSSITLIPTTVISLRAAAGSASPAEVVGTTIFATACSTVAALVADRALRRFTRPGR